MRKQVKSKRRSCGLCKPHKRGMENRWKPKFRDSMIEAEKEILLEVSVRAERIIR